MIDYYDIKPTSPIAAAEEIESDERFPIDMVAPVVGMDKSFVKKVTGKTNNLTTKDVFLLLSQDCFAETFVPRSKVIGFLLSEQKRQESPETAIEPNTINKGDALDLIKRLKNHSVQTVVTSTPYWAMRIYDAQITTRWADGEECSYGLEQTPEGFIRHSVEILYRLMPKLKQEGSVWWNLGDSYNTRTQIRANAAEALHAMQGNDSRSWKDYKYKRYSNGHAYLKDGEQCMIPFKIAERASKIGYFLRSTISWCKTSSMPEPQNSRVSRAVEYIFHLSIQRTPYFDKAAYLTLEPLYGGRQPNESEKLSDYWLLPTSSGRDGHGAQFPLELPGRCIALSSKEGDIVLDPFMGSGTTAIAAIALKRPYIGFDICDEYIKLCEERIEKEKAKLV